MAPSSYKAKPRVVHKYPALAFHFFRLLQFVCASIISGIMFYFIYHLVHKSWYIPWMFYFLLGAALASFVYILISSFVYCSSGINALYNAIANGILSALWIVGFSLLTNAMRSTITRQCTPTYWGQKNGVTICILYKALLVGSLVGALSSIVCTAIDVKVYRQGPVKGKYVKATSLCDETEYKPRS